MKEFFKFKKPCKDCKELFRPTGKFSVYCDECIKKKEKKRFQKMREARERNKLLKKNDNK